MSLVQNLYLHKRLHYIHYIELMTIIPLEPSSTGHWFKTLYLHKRLHYIQYIELMDIIPLEFKLLEVIGSKTLTLHNASKDVCC